MSIPYTTKVNDRLISQPISNEQHTIGIVGVGTYASSQIRLIEVPEGPAPALTITGTGGPYNEILSGTPTGGQFLVNYPTGTVTFASTQNGNVVYVSYNGTGSEVAAEDINELQEPLSTILTSTLTYNPPYTSASVSWGLNTGIAVTSLNGLQDAVTLSAGTNITITPVGNSLVIDAAGTGGMPGGTAGAVQFNSAGVSFGGDVNHLSWNPTTFQLGLNTNSPGSTLDNNGSFANVITNVASNYTVTATDYSVFVNASASNVNITLPKE